MEFDHETKITIKVDSDWFQNLFFLNLEQAGNGPSRRPAQGSKK